MLTIKDFFTTIIIGVIIAMYYPIWKSTQFPHISNVRVATIIVAVLGIFICALGTPPQSGDAKVWMVFASILGLISLLLIIASLITGNKIIFSLLVVTIVVLWLATTVKHLFIK